MCYNCGCQMPDNDMGNPKNITSKTFEKAAKAAGQSTDEAKKKRSRASAENDVPEKIENGWALFSLRRSRWSRNSVSRATVLETKFHTQTGLISTVHLMPVASDEEKKTILSPEHEILGAFYRLP